MWPNIDHSRFADMEDSTSHHTEHYPAESESDYGEAQSACPISEGLLQAPATLPQTSEESTTSESSSCHSKSKKSNDSTYTTCEEFDFDGLGKTQYAKDPENPVDTSEMLRVQIRSRTSTPAPYTQSGIPHPVIFIQLPTCRQYCKSPVCSQIAHDFKICLE